MHVTSAKHIRHRLLDLRFRGFGTFIQKGFRGHDDAVDAEAALHGLFVDERLLDRMRFLDRAESFKRCDVAARYGADRSDTRSNCFTLYDHGTRAALSEAAAKFRRAIIEIV